MAILTHRRMFLIVLLVITVIAVPTATVIGTSNEPHQTALNIGNQGVYIQVSWAHGYESFEELSNTSDLIALGRIEDINSVTSIPIGRKTEEGEPRIYSTQFLFSVDTIIKGEKVDQVIINQTGAPDKQILINDPLYSVGETYVMFLKEYEPGKYYTLGGPQGRYIVNDGGKVFSMNHVFEDQVLIPLGLDIEGWQEDRFISAITNITE